MKKGFFKLWKWIDGGTTGDRKFNFLTLIILVPIVIFITFQILLL